MKFIKIIKLLSIFLTVYLPAVASCEVQPCVDYLSVSLENGSKLKNGSVIFENLTFPPEAQYTVKYVSNGTSELRGCPCLVTNCIRRCCKPGESYNVDKCEKLKMPINGDSDVPPIPVDSLHPEMVRSIDENFYVINAPGCLNEMRMAFYTGKRKRRNVTLKADGILTIDAAEAKDIRHHRPDMFCIGWSSVNNDTKFVTCKHPIDVEAEKWADIYSYMRLAKYWTSAVFFGLTFVVYSMFSSLRNLPGKTLMSYIACLIVAYVLTPFIELRYFHVNGVISDLNCRVIGHATHFSFLGTFFWLNVMCFDIWWTFGGFRSPYRSAKYSESKRFIVYSAYAWSCTTIITGIVIILDMTPGISESVKPEFATKSCWFDHETGKTIYLYGPMLITIISNIVLFILTAVKIAQHKQDSARHLNGSESRRHDDHKQWFNLYLKLFLVMGMTWTIEIINWLFDKSVPQYFWHIIDFPNTLQGVIIFIIFVCKKKIKDLLIKRFGHKKTNGSFTSAVSRSINGSIPDRIQLEKTTC